MADATQYLIDLVDGLVPSHAHFIHLEVNGSNASATVGSWQAGALEIEKTEVTDVPGGIVDAAAELVSRRAMTLPSKRIVRFASRPGDGRHYISAYVWPERTPELIEIVGSAPAATGEAPAETVGTE